MTTVVPADVVAVRTHGHVTADEINYARSKILAATRYAHGPVLLTRVKLTRLADPAVGRRAVVQANVDVNGRVLRAQVARPSMREAADEAHDRLRDRIQRAAGRWDAKRRPTGRRVASPRRTAKAVVARRHERPVGQDREVVRHKTFPLRRQTVDEAAYEMEMLDYEFHLFVERGTGVDSLLVRTGPVRRGYRLFQLDPSPRDVVRGLVPVTVSSNRAPTLSLHAATMQLEELGWPYLFFRDAIGARGCVLYRRYDGRLGWISPPPRAGRTSTNGRSS
jgi:ribosome-associated translation inhibitor RaiA